MRIARESVGATVATLFVVSVLIQSLGTAQAEKLGYIQRDCPTIVQKAIDTVSAQCSKAGRNKLCYGNSTIQAMFQPGAGNITFHAPGDTVDVAQIKQFTLGGMDTAANVWGVAEMKIKADLSDADPTLAVTMILFGDVQLTDATNDANTAVLTQTPGAIARQNQYATATTRAIDQKQTQIAATATKLNGIEVTATARALTPTPTGTIPAYKATQAAATATKLAAIENTVTAAPIPGQPGAVNGPYKGLQAFYFQSNDTAPCDQAPHDGILIQSPQGKRRVTLSIDGATISLGSTVYITAQPGKFLTINTLEGSAIVAAAGTTQSANGGVAVQVPLDTNLRASGPPSTPVAYTPDSIRALPTRILPNNSIQFLPGLPANAVFTIWNVTDTVQSGPCFFGTSQNPKNSESYHVSGYYNQSALWFNALAGGTVVVGLSAPGRYTGTVLINGTSSDYALVLQVDGTLSGNVTVTFLADGSVCAISRVLIPTGIPATTASPSPAAKS